MNAHQRRKQRRCYERTLGLKRVPYHLLELAADVPGGLEQAQELCRAASIPAALYVFKLDLDGTLDVVPPPSVAQLNSPFWPPERCKPQALDYFAWRRRRAEEDAP